MPGKQAKILSPSDLHDLLIYASTTRHPRRNRLIVLLSVKAGLRAGEIAALTWDMVLTASGDVAPCWNCAMPSPRTVVVD
jgi:integrase